MALVIHDLEQGSDEWLRARSGIVTMSELEAILTPINVTAYQFGETFVEFAGGDDLAQSKLSDYLDLGEPVVLKSGENKGKLKSVRVSSDVPGLVWTEDDRSGMGSGAITYMYKLIGERVTGKPVESANTWQMQRGHELEPVARELYSMQTDNESVICGFMTNHDCGFSPDSLVGLDGISEIKTKEPHLQAALLFSNEVPSEHIAQVQGGLWISGREWCDFVSYCPGMPLFVKKVFRDESFIDNIAYRVNKFYTELDRRMKIIVNR